MAFPSLLYSSDDRDALDLEELLKASASAFLAEAGQADPAERPVHAEVGRPVDQYLAGHQFAGEPMGRRRSLVWTYAESPYSVPFAIAMASSILVSSVRQAPRPQASHIEYPYFSND
jgi:hypothetical protein